MMKLAAIDIGTNSIHMVIVQVNPKYTFDVIHREKAMVKLGEGVFATNRLSARAYREGLATIQRYVQLADQQGVDEIITAATSAIREARNGGEFLDEVIQKTGISPQVISGKEEARLIFLAVRHAIDLQEGNTLVLDIGGGSTEAVVGNNSEVFFRSSIKLGVRRLLDMFENEGPVGKEARGVLEAHIKYIARDVLEEAQSFGFSRVVGTSGTIRTMGEAAHLIEGGKPWPSVNAEVVSRDSLNKLTGQLLEMSAEQRSELSGINKTRADAIHLGGVLLSQLLEMLAVSELVLCDASLREGLIIDYIQRHSKQALTFADQEDLRHRSAAQLARQFDSDLEQKLHVAALALQLFDQSTKVHRLGSYERDILEYAAILHGIGQYISFKSYHKHSRYIIKHSELRGFTNEEVLLIGQVVRYHRKKHPHKKQKKFKRLTKEQQHIVQLLAGMLRIAVALDITKSQLVSKVDCRVSKKKITIAAHGEQPLELEIWAAQRHKGLLEMAVDREVTIEDDFRKD